MVETVVFTVVALVVEKIGFFVEGTVELLVVFEVGDAVAVRMFSTDVIDVAERPDETLESADSVKSDKTDKASEDTVADSSVVSVVVLFVICAFFS